MHMKVVNPRTTFGCNRLKHLPQRCSIQCPLELSIHPLGETNRHSLRFMMVYIRNSSAFAEDPVGSTQQTRDA